MKIKEIRNIAKYKNDIHSSCSVQTVSGIYGGNIRMSELSRLSELDVCEAKERKMGTRFFDSYTSMEILIDDFDQYTQMLRGEDIRTIGDVLDLLDDSLNEDISITIGCDNSIYTQADLNSILKYMNVKIIYWNLWIPENALEIFIEESELDKVLK